MNKFLDIISDNRSGKNTGIYAICTAHPLVLEAALEQGKRDGTPVLVEATANQVNQFGGYTGMLPADFVPFIEAIADKVAFPKGDLILGGDHLGPVVWCDEAADSAMEKAATLIEAYVAAGFKKIHLDTSMACAGDPTALSDEVVADRAASLCLVAEETAQKHFGQSNLVYVVGTEVPPPGGATEDMSGLQVTPTEAVKVTVDAHKQAFYSRGLEQAWTRVIGLVVQPGVEFDHTTVHNYQPEKATQLSALIQEIPNLVYEAHSTDYQPSDAYSELVKGHFAILKVGPQLTFALREALFALSRLEDELIEPEERSELRDVCEAVMLKEPKNWAKYYPTQGSLSRLYRRYSYSDRIRYYWTNEEVSSAVSTLLNNLAESDIPLPLLSQYMPLQYNAIRAGKLENEVESLIKFQISEITNCYARACNGNAA